MVIFEGYTALNVGYFSYEAAYLCAETAIPECRSTALPSQEVGRLELSNKSLDEPTAWLQQQRPACFQPGDIGQYCGYMLILVSLIWLFGRHEQLQQDCPEDGIKAESDSLYWLGCIRSCMCRMTDWMSLMQLALHCMHGVRDEYDQVEYYTSILM